MSGEIIDRISAVIMDMIISWSDWCIYPLINWVNNSQVWTVIFSFDLEISIMFFENLSL